MSVSLATERSCGDTQATLADRLAVLRVAGEVEPDPGRALAWYQETPIARFGSCTADELVRLGRVADVMAFLHSIAK
ncbi:hypothetical protein [Rhodanobacter hydrolyticus]|uniref:Antitoxin Xre/MbcA/ParS-like toxin-binding domain-containing protein n=1 Tax=Rhodanobacter hydrolyticus TaxID=2250595 RepID=A0ABW8J9S6_9GAMM